MSEVLILRELKPLAELDEAVHSPARRTLAFAALGVGTLGLVLALLEPLWAFTYWIHGGVRSSADSIFFSVGSPGAYFQSNVIGSGPAPPPQATLDLNVVLWADLAFGILAGIVAILRGVLAFRRPSVPALTQGATVTSLGLSAIAAVLVFALGPTAYSPGTWCPGCTALSGQSPVNDWAWVPEVGAFALLIAIVAFLVALVLQAIGPPDRGRWMGRLGGAGVVAGFALFSAVFGNDWQAWYPTGTPYTVLWVLIVAIPVSATALTVRGVRRINRTTAERD